MARPAPDRGAVAATIAYQARQTALRGRAADVVRTSWTGMGSWHRDDVARFAARTAPVVAGGQKVMSALTVGYLNGLRAAAHPKAKPVHVPPADVTGPALRGGLDPLDEWARPGETVWFQLDQGTPLDEAVGMGLDRALAMLAVDLQLAKTWTARDFLGRDNHATGWERVPDGTACELCLEAANDGPYHTEDLAPIHNYCGCDVAPVYDTGETVPTDVLDTGDTAPIDEGDTYAVEQHGEIGPVLVVAGQDFRDAADVAADSTTT